MVEALLKGLLFFSEGSGAPRPRSYSSFTINKERGLEIFLSYFVVFGLVCHEWMNGGQKINSGTSPVLMDLRRVRGGLL